jgi:hypothetical protein
MVAAEVEGAGGGTASRHVTDNRLQAAVDLELGGRADADADSERQPEQVSLEA